MTYVFNPTYQLLVLASAFAAVHLLASGRTFIFASHTILFAALTAVLVSHGIEPYQTTAQAPGGLWVKLFYGAAKATWWIGGALMLVSSVRLFLIFEGRPREGRLVQDLLAGLIYTGAALSIVAYVFNVPVGTLIATSGVIAVILGLALQSTLSDVFSGVALNLGRPYSVGDWIILDTGVQGRVVETNWRATHLLNGTNDLVVIPNSTLAKSQLVNQSSPDETHGVTLTVRVITSRSPTQIQQVFSTILLGGRHTLREPAPLVTMGEMDGQSIGVELAFRVADAGQIITAKNEMLDLIFRHLKAEGLALATSVPNLGVPLNITSIGSAAADPSDQHDAIRDVPLFAALTENELNLLTQGVTRKTYARGTEIIHQGEKSGALMVVTRGVVIVEKELGNSRIELNRLSPGDFFGERGLLMGAEEPGFIRALSQVSVLEITSEDLSKILHARPDLADDLGATLAARLDAEAEYGVATPSMRRPLTIAHRIRHLFQL
ncbi:mechanosensitive ion channel family protein [Rhizobium sp. S152]|uniref:mechanosensitive ion channel family protein n=1 Tax=Rhizobium sp. S152 TaxID=3055038 RepID=UPI0025A95462|nr:mechanosensitive ion channel family protein [Rhizobium sp. S152]MDM9627517.1 mechanosensitive ion channel family protein [Rhizobium sp. S152]